MKRERVIELWLAGFVLVAGLIVVVVLLGTAAADGPPMSERADLSFSHIHNLLPANTVYAFGHLGVDGNIIKRNKVDPLCNEKDGCYPYGDGCEERDYYCMGTEAGCNYTSSNRHTDGWVDTGNTRWVDVNKCKENEQKEQEYRDYKCSAGSCHYSINDTKWIDTGICNSTCNCVSLAPPEITSFAPLSYVDDTICNWRTFDVTINQAVNVSWYLNNTLVLTNESVLEAKCTLHADVVGEHNVTAIASNANGSDMQTWTWAVTELQKECEGTDTSCGIYPNCENCNEKDGCYPYGDGCEERDYYCKGNGTGCNYTSSNRHTDSWVDTGNTRWVDVNKCKEKEQKEQEYRDYKCSAGCCHYSINDTKWIDTGIYNATCSDVSLAPPEITSFTPLSYVDDTVGNGRTFNVTVNQAANVSWYLNNMLVLTNESVLEAKCTLHADVVGEHNVTAIASNANGSDMQTWILNVTEGLKLNCACGDICVDTTGWWRDGGAFHPSDTPIQGAIDNAIAGETICVTDGTYNENVDVNKRLTIRSENGYANCVVQAANPNDHVFEVTTSYVNITGFTVKGATNQYKAGIYLHSYSYCNISNNNALNNYYGIRIDGGTFPVTPTTGTSDYLSNNRLVNNSGAAYFLGTNIYPTPGAEINDNGFNGIKGLADYDVTRSVTVNGTYKLDLWLWDQYASRAVTIEKDAILTIAPGVKVQMQAGRKIEVKNGGSLIANGTSDSHITFTADSGTPSRGHWDSIYFYPGSSGSLRYCDIEWGGRSSDAVYYNNPAAGSLTIDHCEIRESGNHGIWGTSSSSGVTITNNNVHDNTENGIHIKSGSFPVNGTTGTADNLSNNRQVNNGGAAYHLCTNIYPTPGSAEVSGNGFDGIMLNAASTVVTVSGTYKMPLYLWVEYSGQHHRLTINSGATVTIPAGLRVQVQRTIGIDVDGSLVAEGTESEHIIFTADVASPNRGHWDHVFFYSGSSGSLKYCDIEWGGGSDGAIYYNNPAAGSLTIDHCEIRESGNHGIWGTSSSSGVTITNNNVHDNTENGIHIKSGSFPVNGTTGTADNLSNNRQVNNGGAAYHLCTNIYPTPGSAEVSGNGFDGIMLNAASTVVTVSGTYKMPLYLWVEYSGQHHRLTINSGATVTIPAGLRVQVQRTIGIDVDGSLVAEGTESEHIIFTADVASPNRGHWDHVFFYSGSSGSLKYCDIEWGGGSDGAIYYNNPAAGSLTIDHCEIRESGNHGIWGTSSSSGVTITNNNVHDNTENGIHIKSGSFPVNGTTGTADNLSNNRQVNNGGAAYHLCTNIYPTPGSAEVSGNGFDGIMLNAASTVVTVSGTYKMPLYLWVEYSGQHHRLTINSGATVTIPAGLRVQVQRTIGIDVKGSLVAEGTESEHIIFTADVASPNRGHWDHVFFYSGSSGSLKYCDIEWGGGSNGAIYYNNPAAGSLTIDHCEIRESGNHGIWGTSSSGGVTITNNNAHDNTENGIHIESGSFPVNGTTGTADNLSNNRLVNNGGAAYFLGTNIYPTPGAEINDNGFNGIKGLADYDVTRSVTVNGTYKLDLWLWDQYAGRAVTIEKDAILTIAPGVKVQMQAGRKIEVKNGGSLIANGTSDSHITFTADSGTPSRGHWDSIYFYPGSSGSLRYCDIEWGGGSNGAIYYNNPAAGSLTIDHCEIRESGNHGIRGTSSSSGVTITACKIYENTDHGISISNSRNTIIRGCTINNNTRGIDLSGSNNNNITTNTAESNEQGIYLTTSSSNLLYNNYFNNTNNAYDEGDNTWNITKEAGTNIIGGSWLGGNYWSDYAGEDTNGDGLGDTLLPYNSDGEITTGGDWHPLVESAISLHDLVITEKWLCWPDNCTICYNVTNTGDGTAPACHNTALYVDGVVVAHDHVLVDLAPGESYLGCFNGYVWTYTPPSDNITVCADNNETLDELDETNNCLTNIWMCGDVTGDGRVRTSDGRRIFRHLTFGDPIDNMWAADVTGDGRVRTSDGRRIFRHLTFGDPLNCNCSG